MLLALGAGVSGLVLPGHLAALVTLVAVGWVVPALGKAFPRAALAMGIVLALLPVGLSPVSGCGLGLAIVAALVKRHGEALTARTTVMGAAFACALPCPVCPKPLLRKSIILEARTRHTGWGGGA